MARGVKLTEERKRTLLAYCRLDEDEVDPELMQTLYDDAVGYLEQSGVYLPEEGTLRRAQYDMCVNALVLDAHDNRGTEVSGSLAENPAFRRKLNQLKLTQTVPNLGTGSIW